MAKHKTSNLCLHPGAIFSSFFPDSQNSLPSS